MCLVFSKMVQKAENRSLKLSTAGRALNEAAKIFKVDEFEPGNINSMMQHEPIFHIVLEAQLKENGIKFKIKYTEEGFYREFFVAKELKKAGGIIRQEKKPTGIQEM